MINASAAFVAWNPLGEDDHNGPLLGYKVSSFFSTNKSLFFLLSLPCGYWCNMGIVFPTNFHEKCIFFCELSYGSRRGSKKAGCGL